MLTGCWQDRNGTGFCRVDVGSIDRLVRWNVTYCVGCRSAETWGCARLCVALECV
jgi:hypothetical protein